MLWLAGDARLSLEDGSTLIADRFDPIIALAATARADHNDEPLSMSNHTRPPLYGFRGHGI